MNDSKEDAASGPPEEKAVPPSGAEDARAALVAKLSQMFRAPVRVKPPRSLQPTPEAAKTRLARLRRKQRMLIQKSKRAAVPPAPDPLSP